MGLPLGAARTLFRAARTPSNQLVLGARPGIGTLCAAVIGSRSQGSFAARGAPRAAPRETIITHTPEKRLLGLLAAADLGLLRALLVVARRLVVVVGDVGHAEPEVHEHGEALEADRDREADEARPVPHVDPFRRRPRAVLAEGQERPDRRPEGDAADRE